MLQQLKDHPDRAAYRAEYEEDFLNYLESLIRDCDIYITREQAKCRTGGGTVTNFTVEAKEQYDEMDAKYQMLIKESEELADESVSRSRDKMNHALQIKEDMQALKEKHTKESAADGICEVCGVKYPLNDSAHDKTSHYRGKTHEGFVRIRAEAAKLKLLRKQWDKQKDRISELKDKHRKRDKDKAKEESRKKRKLDEEREKERQREKEQEAVREKERERQREIDRRRKEERDKEEEKKRKENEEKEKERRTLDMAKFAKTSILWEKIKGLRPTEKRKQLIDLSDEEQDMLVVFLEARVEASKR